MILSSVVLLASFILAGRAQRRIDSERMATTKLRGPAKLKTVAAVSGDEPHTLLQNESEHRFAPRVSSTLLAESIQVDEYKSLDEV